MVTILFIIQMAMFVFDSTHGFTEVPFTQDFNHSLHGWVYNRNFMSWTGKSRRLPDIKNDSRFHSNGNYVWTQRHAMPRFSTKYLESGDISGVNNDTKFHIRYWFDASEESSYLNITLTNSAMNMSQVTVISNNTDNWEDVSIHCQPETCCYNERCTIKIHITPWLDNFDGSDLVAIRCISTEDNGCGPLPSPCSANTTTSDEHWITTTNTGKSGSHKFSTPIPLTNTKILSVSFIIITTYFVFIF